MATWVTIETAAERYLVGTNRLLDYAQRGNLPIRRTELGAVFVDETAVAMLFRPRRPAVITHPQPQGPHLGILGVQRLGQASNARDGRRRAPVTGAAQSGTFEAAPRKATG
jgi:hypothetical protein